MSESSEAKATESGDETLAKLGSALGQPPRSMLDNANALFAFISDDDDARSADSVSAAPATPADQVRGDEALLTTSGLRPLAHQGD
jgi:hypothetical protein